MDIGISLYLGTGLQKNLEIIQKAKQAKVKYIFTSLHIPEEKVDDYPKQVQTILAACQENDLQLLVDVSPKTLEKIGYHSFDELAKTSIRYLRLDSGFNHQDIVNLSRQFNIVFNASTLTSKDMIALQKLGADFSTFIACHNFYPKPLTALSIEKVVKINRKLQYLGMRTMAFVAGDLTLRGPLKLGLPTIEKHRQGDVLENILELYVSAETDICMIGDIDVQEKTWQQLQDLSNGFVRLKANILPSYDFIKNMIHHDRSDSSEYVIRSQESRGYAAIGRKITPMDVTNSRNKGSIFISNELYERYSGEIEIARIDLPIEKKVNTIGEVIDEYKQYLSYICDGIGFILE